MVICVFQKQTRMAPVLNSYFRSSRQAALALELLSWADMPIMHPNVHRASVLVHASPHSARSFAGILMENLAQIAVMKSGSRCPFMAQSRHPDRAGRMSALGGKADIEI